AGLLSTLHLDGREEPLNVFGPDGLRHYLNASFRTSELQFRFPLHVQEFPRGFRGRVVEGPDFYVDALPLEHSIFCLGWRVQEKTKPGTFDIGGAEALGIPRGPLYGKLQHGENITMTDVRSRRSVMRPGVCLKTSRSAGICSKWKFSALPAYHVLRIQSSAHSIVSGYCVQ